MGVGLSLLEEGSALVHFRGLDPPQEFFKVCPGLLEEFLEVLSKKLKRIL